MIGPLGGNLIRKSAPCSEREGKAVSNQPQGDDLPREVSEALRWKIPAACNEMPAQQRAASEMSEGRRGMNGAGSLHGTSGGPASREALAGLHN